MRNTVSPRTSRDQERVLTSSFPPSSQLAGYYSGTSAASSSSRHGITDLVDDFAISGDNLNGANDEGGIEREAAPKQSRDVWLNRHPRGRTCRSSGTFRPSRPRKKHPTGVDSSHGAKILRLGLASEEGRNNLHACSTRRTDGLMSRYCDA